MHSTIISHKEQHTVIITVRCSLCTIVSMQISSSETQGQIVGLKTKIKTGGKKLELVRKEFVPRGSHFSFILLLIEFFPTRFDFRLRPHYLPLGLRGCANIY